MKEQLRCPSLNSKGKICNRKLGQIEFTGNIHINIKCPKCSEEIHFYLNSKKGIRTAEVIGKGVKGK